jgi:hypothetical protein
VGAFGIIFAGGGGAGVVGIGAGVFCTVEESGLPVSFATSLA